MPDSHFPPEVPNIDDAIRITPVREEYVPREYKFFCEESHVMSRFFAIDHADRKYIIVSLSGDKIRQIDFNVEHQTWSTFFDEQRVQLEVEKILE